MISLSICIPSKNRYYTLEILLEYLLSSSSRDFEVIVLDTSSNKKDLLLSDHRLSVYSKPSTFSVIDSFEFVVAKAQGEWIIVLGDDDCIDIENSLRILSKVSSYDTVICSKANYAWPDITHRNYGNALSGKLNLMKKYTGRTKNVDNNKILAKVLRRGGVNGLDKLPRIYHGFVKRGIVKSLRVEFGTVFPGPSPDMASSVFIAQSNVNSCHVDLPLVISGHSASSTAGQSNRGEHQGAIEKIEHLPKNSKDTWSIRIPKFWSAGTVYAQSLESALRITGNNRSLSQLNYSYLYSHLFVHNFKYKNDVLRTIPITFYEFFWLAYYIIIICAKRGINLINRILFYRILFVVIPDINNIKIAMPNITDINDSLID